jgi:curved DNA-binding protein CbpA
MNPYQTQNYFELLEVPPTASLDEIRAAYERQQALYAADSVALYVLDDPGQVEALRQLLVEALDILTDEDLRAEYHKQLGLPPPVAPAPPAPAAAVPAPAQEAAAAAPVASQAAASQAAAFQAAAPPAAVAAGTEAPATAEAAAPTAPAEALQAAAAPAVAQQAATLRALPSHEEPARTPAPAPAAEEAAAALAEPTASGLTAVGRAGPGRDTRPRHVEITPESEFSGELLRRLREARGWTLQQMADRTRISSRHLENIEADRYAALPATVYLRGMLMSLAKELGQEPARVSRSYMDLVARLGKGGPR